MDLLSGIALECVADVFAFCHLSSIARGVGSHVCLPVAFFCLQAMSSRLLALYVQAIVSVSVAVRHVLKDAGRYVFGNIFLNAMSPVGSYVFGRTTVIGCHLWIKPIGPTVTGAKSLSLLNLLYLSLTSKPCQMSFFSLIFFLAV